MIKRIKQQIDFIKEIDKMKNIFRMTLVSESYRRENDAEHSWHLAMMAVLLQEHSNAPVNIEHVLKMILVHDLVEVYAGDTFAYDTKANEDKAEREEEAAKKLFSMLPKDQQQEIYTLWKEFDAMQSDDSKFANAMDRLQPFLSNTMTEGHTWKVGRVNKQMIYERMDPIRTATPALWSIITEYVDEMAKMGYIFE